MPKHQTPAEFAMTSHSHSEDPEPEVAAEETLQIQNPISTQDEENQPPPQLEKPQPDSQPQSPQTLETQDPQNPEKLDPNQEDQQVMEQESGMFLSPPPPLIACLNPPRITSPTTNPYRRNHKRKKGGHKKQQAIDKKVQILLENLNLIPFIPSKTLDFPKHEKLLKRLGLWDFVHIEFDRSIRADLIAQLIVTFDLPKQCSYVNGFRIVVNRSALARAIKLPLAKKEKSFVNVVEGAVDLDLEELSDESISLIEDVVSNWVLLHEDAWITPSEVRNWMQVIKDGHPEKVDWANLVWHMAKNELKQGVQLGDCYYASHMQCLIMSQREELFWEEPPKVELEVEVKEEEDGGLNESSWGEDNVVLDEPNIELTLGGQDIVEKEETKNADMRDVEECKEEEQGQWGLAGKNNTGEHFLQRCSLDCNAERKQEVEEEVEVEEEEEEEDGIGCNIAPNYGSLERDNLNANLLQEFEATELSFSSQGQQLHEQSSLELLASRAETHMILGGPSIFSNGGKREIEHEQDTSHLGSNKRMRTDVQWDHKSSDFGFCIGQAQQLMEKAKIMYEAKEQAFQESTMNQQILLDELQRRENLIEHLHKTKFEEQQKKEGEILRLERELYVMGNLLDGYRKALKETNKAFFEYRQRCQLPEEPIYKDAGPGGLVLSITELEKQRQKQEEEDRLNRSMMEEKFNEALEEYIGKFEVHLDKVQMLNIRLLAFENEVKLLKELSAKRKASEMSGCVPSE